MAKKIVLIFILVPVLLFGKTENKNFSPQLQSLKEKFIEQRFGMFICYNIMSYGAKWGEVNFPIESFNPQKLDCNQWADAAVLGGMKFGLLTTKHHEGFCLWDSKFTKYDVASTPYKNDIVRQYVDAFRAKGLGVGLYYSIWDSTHDIDKGKITPGKMDFIKGQITELLANYGKIDYFVIDGWNWRMGHVEVPFHEIRKLIRDLQPDCLITDHTHLQAPYHMEIPYFEGPFGAFPPENNKMASALGHCSVNGNGWFWSEKTPGGMKQNDGTEMIFEKLTQCESRYCNFMLNCMPNRDGLLDEIYINLLSEIGKKWSPDKSRPPLPGQGPQIGETLPVKIVAASSGIAENLIDAVQKEGCDYHDWEANSGLPQTILIDLGAKQQNVSVLLLVNKHRCKPAPETSLTDGNVLKYRLFTGNTKNSVNPVSSISEFKSNGYLSIGFKPETARFIKLEILDAVGGKAIINEIEVGILAK